jgi:plasmid stability protein
MPTLHVRNVPQDLYKALRKRARVAHRSIAAEVLTLLEENIPTAKNLKAQHEFVRKIVRMRSKQSNPRRAFPSAEELLRQDRAR